MQNGNQPLANSRLVEIIQTFFELHDSNMSCNDMLTKILSVFRSAIARGCFEEVLNGFILFLSDGKRKSNAHESRIFTFRDLKILIAGLIKRFSNNECLQQVLNTSNGSVVGPQNMTNGNTSSMKDEVVHAGVRLIPHKKVTVLDPKQAAVLVFIFQAYYMNNAGIEDSSVRSFMAKLERIDESIHGSISVRGSDPRPVEKYLRASLLKTHQNSSKVIQQYIKGEYSSIFSMLNECFLRYDFLNTETVAKKPSNPRSQAKQLVENYYKSFMGSSEVDEFIIWSTHVNKAGAVTSLENLFVNKAYDNNFVSYVILQSLMMKVDEQQPYSEQMKVQKGPVGGLLKTKKYQNLNPYVENITRQSNLNINEKKKVALGKLFGRLKSEI